jgi:MFS family permease
VCALPHLRTHHLIDSPIVAAETKRDEGVSRVYKDHNLHIVWGVTLMAVPGTSSITPAFPTIVRELGVSSGQVGLLITVFTLPGILMTPLLGVLSDRYGRKKILVPALLLFGIAGGACAFARDFKRQGGLRPDRRYPADVYRAFRAAGIIPPDPDERAL